MLSITCPSCQALLKVPESLAGRKAKCTKCGNVLQIPAASGIKARAAAAPAPSRPAARRGRDDEDFEEERPRRRKPPAKKSSALLIGLMSAFVVLLLGGGGLAAFFLLRGKSTTNTSGPEGAKKTLAGLQYLPDNASFVVSIRLADALASDAVKTVKQEIPQLDDFIAGKIKEEGGPPLADIASVLVGGSDSDSTLFIAEMTRPYTAKEFQDLEKKKSYKPQTVGAFTIYESDDSVFCVPSPKIYVEGKKLAVLKAVLERNGPAKLSSNMQAALGRLNTDKAITAAVDVAAAPQEVRADMQKKLTLPETVEVEIDVSKDLAAQAVLNYPNETAAQAAKAQLDQFKANAAVLAMFGAPKEVVDTLTNLPITQDGNKLTASARFAVAPLARTLKDQLAKQNDFGPGPDKGLKNVNPFPPPGPGPNPFPPPVLPPPNRPPANAQADIPLILGPGGNMTVQDQLTPQDARDRVRRGSHHKAYALQMVAGKTYQINMRSGQIDSYLRLENAAGVQLAFDDDGGGFPNARIIFRAPATGTYRIICTTFRTGETGVFTLTVDERQVQRPPPNRPPGVTTNLGLQACTLLAGKEREFRVDLNAGQPVQFTVTTRLLRKQLAEPDVDLFVFGPTGAQIAADVRISKDAHVQFTPRVNGVYRVVVRNLGPGTAHSTLRQH